MDRLGQDKEVLRIALDDLRVRFGGLSQVASKATNACFSSESRPADWASEQGLFPDEQAALEAHQARNATPGHLVLPAAQSSEELADVATVTREAAATLSFPGYDASNRVAVICAGALKGALEGSWHLLILRKTGKTWTITKRFPRLQV